ncbi:MAG: hypothetical protein KF878_36135 [Planctomycetes bacterium]|nr:hypothetical protein [Planctomycetota bacterium]
MDLDAELERLSREARRKLDEERGPPPDDAPTSDVPRTAGRAGVEDAAAEVARAGAGASLGVKLAAVVGGLVAVAVIWSVVIAPLLKLAFVVAVIALVVWVFVKLLGGDDPGEDAPGP